MPTSSVASRSKDFPKTRYIDSLMWIVGAEVILAWLFLLALGLVQVRVMGSIAPVATAVGFAMAGLAMVEYGVVVLNVQLAWILPDDHDESAIAPFLCGHCLLAQSLLMFPPTIFFAIILVPLFLVSIAGVGWYFQKFTSLRLTQPGREEYQRPLSLKTLLWMPATFLALGILPFGLLMLCGVSYFDYAMQNSRFVGIAIICSAMGMVAVSFLPLMICYAFLFLTQCKRSTQFLAGATCILALLLAVAIEALASKFQSATMPLVAMAAFMFVTGVWVGFRPWHQDGLRVVVAKPIANVGVEPDLRFDEMQ